MSRVCFIGPIGLDRDDSVSTGRATDGNGMSNCSRRASDPSAVFLAHLTIGFRPSGSAQPPAILPVGPPMGFTGTHNRLHSIAGLLEGLAPGTYEIGIAGLGYPEPVPQPPIPLPTIHRIR